MSFIRNGTSPAIAGKPAAGSQPFGMNGMIVRVVRNVTVEPRAPRIPNLLSQNPAYKRAQIDHSDASRRSGGGHATSAMCQYATSRHLFDYLVGAAEQREQVESPYAGWATKASFRPSVCEVYFSYLRFAWFRTWTICR